MSDESNHNGLRKFFKVLLTIIVVLVAIVVIGFGLLVGFCAFGSKL